MSRTEDEYVTATLREYMLTCHQCGNDVTNCEIKIADETVIETQQRLYDIVEEGVNAQIIYIESYFSVLHHVAKLLIADNNTSEKLRKFIAEVYLIGGYDQIIAADTAYKLVRKHAPKERATVTTLAYWLLEKWPNRFIDLCNKHEIESKTILFGFKKAPYWFWKPVSEQLTFIPSPVIILEYIEQIRCEHEPIHILEVSMDKTLDYDYDLNEYYYDDNDEYADIDLAEYVI